MKRFQEWCERHKDKINAFAPFFLASYFLILVFPYCTGRIPVLYSAICVNVIGRVIFRLVPTAYLFVYGIMAGTANKSRFRWEWLFPMVALWITYALAWITTPDTYTYVSESWNRSLTYYSTTVGWVDETISFGTLIAETSILLIWMSFLPDAIKNRKGILIPLITIIIFAWATVIASLGLEWSLYVRLFRGGDHKLIHSIFFQKNEYGAFLFAGTFASCFLAYFKKGKAKFIFGLSALLLTIITFLVRCYTALMSEVVAVIALLVGWAAELRKKHALLSVGLFGGGVLTIALIIGLAYVPDVRNSVSFFRILFNSLDSVEKEVMTRTVIWQHAPEVVDGFHLFLGVTDEVSDAKLASLQIVDQEGVVAIFHNSYIAYLAIHGLIGLLVYFALIFKAAKNGFKFKKLGFGCVLFLFLLLIGYLLQGMAETYVLFIKMSVLTLPLTFIFFVFLPAMKKEEMYEL